MARSIVWSEYLTRPPSTTLGSHSVNINKHFLIKFLGEIYILKIPLDFIPLVKVVTIFQTLGQDNNISTKVIVRILLGSPNPVTLQTVCAIFFANIIPKSK